MNLRIVRGVYGKLEGGKGGGGNYVIIFQFQILETLF